MGKSEHIFHIHYFVHHSVTHPSIFAEIYVVGGGDDRLLADCLLTVGWQICVEDVLFIFNKAGTWKTYKLSTVFSDPSPTFMNTSSKVVTDTPKLAIPYSSILSTGWTLQGKTTKSSQKLSERCAKAWMLHLNCLRSILQNPVLISKTDLPQLHVI